MQQVRWWGVPWVLGDTKGRRPTVHCTTSPSNGDGWFPKAVAWQVGWLLCKTVRRSVGAPQVHDGGPSDPKQLHLHLWIKSTLDQRWRGSVEALPRISDVAGARGLWPTPCGIGQRGPMGPRPLPCLLAFYAPLLYSFVKIPPYKCNTLKIVLFQNS
jgi:hypothetical protein